MNAKSPCVLLLAGFVVVSCERQDPGVRGNDNSKEVLEALDDAKAALSEERRKLELEREALAAEREAARDTVVPPVVPPAVELTPLPDDLEDERNEATRRVLEEWERMLDQREKELAGKEALVDAEELRQPPAFREPVGDYGLFYDSLADHGQWFETVEYGYIFQPTVVVQDRSWRPYTRGRWVCSDRGWLWVSDEPFGWACFHYGRWVLIAGRGWCWVPGNEWAPSWVAWRQGGGHVGWAPLPPETLCVTGRNWGVNVEIDFGIADSWFCFVEEPHFARPILRHCLPVGRNVVLRPRANPCTNLYYVHGQPMSCGPSYASLRRHSTTPWPVWPIEIDPIGGMGRPDLRPGGIHGRNWRVFAPNLRSPWNPACRPEQVQGRLGGFEVVRAPGGVQSEWQQRFEERRRQQQAEAGEWASRMHRARLDQIENNRREVEAAWERLRQQQAQAGQLPGQVPGGGRRPDGAGPGGRGPGGREPEGGTPGGGGRPGPGRPGNEGIAGGGGQPAAGGSAGAGEGVANPDLSDAERVRLAEQAVRQEQEARRRAEEERIAGEERAREAMREQQRTAEEAVEQREAQRRAEEEVAREAAARNGGDAGEGGRPMREEEAREQEELARRQQEEMQRQAAAEQAAREQEESTRRELDEAMRRQQAEEHAKLQEEEARRQQEAMQRQQEEEANRGQAEEMTRQQAEEARRQQQQMQREQEEQVQRQQAEEMARRQAEEAARQQAEEMARQQEEARRQQEELQRQQEEQMRRQQAEEMARRQAEEAARQQAEEMARQQEEARRQQEEQMRRQQEEIQRQQEEQMRRQQEEMQRQQEEQMRRQQEEMQRQQEEMRRLQEEQIRRQQEEIQRQQQQQQQ